MYAENLSSLVLTFKERSEIKLGRESLFGALVGVKMLPSCLLIGESIFYGVRMPLCLFRGRGGEDRLGLLLEGKIFLDDSDDYFYLFDSLSTEEKPECRFGSLFYRLSSSKN